MLGLNFMVKGASEKALKDGVEFPCVNWEERDYKMRKP